MHGVIVWSEMRDSRAFVFLGPEAGLQVSEILHPAKIRDEIEALGVFGVFDDAASVVRADGERIDRVFLRPRHRGGVFRHDATLPVYVEQVLEHREVETGKAMIDHLVTLPIGVALWRGAEAALQT